MFILEVIAVIFSLLSVVLTIRRNILCWPIGLVGIIAYGFVFFNSHLYSNLVLQLIFSIQGIYGWWSWNKAEKNSILITKITTDEKHKLWLVFGILYIISVVVLLSISSSEHVLVETAVAAGSLIANWMIIKKKLEAWTLWIIIDVVYIILFLMSGLYLTTGLYVIFLFTAMEGQKIWKRIHRCNLANKLIIK